MNKSGNKSEAKPKLRFPEFQESSDWQRKELGSIGVFTGGGTPSKENSSYWEGENPWVSRSDISEDDIFGIKISRFISDEAIRETAKKIVPANSILLVSRVGVGKLAITRKEICTSQDFANFTPAKDDLVFLAYALKAMKEVFLSFNQGMAIQGFTKDDASNVKIPLPENMEEQKRIADCLSSVDELISLEAKKLDALRVYKKGLMQQLLPNDAPHERSQPAILYHENKIFRIYGFRKLDGTTIPGNCSSLVLRNIVSNRRIGRLPCFANGQHGGWRHRRSESCFY